MRAGLRCGQRLDDEPDDSVELVDRAVAFEARIRFGHALAPDQRGLALIARLGVDAIDPHALTYHANSTWSVESARQTAWDRHRHRGCTRSIRSGASRACDRAQRRLRLLPLRFLGR